MYLPANTASTIASSLVGDTVQAQEAPSVGDPYEELAKTMHSAAQSGDHAGFASALKSFITTHNTEPADEPEAAETNEGPEESY